MTDVISAEKLLEQAKALDRDKASEIIALLEQARAQDPDNAEILHNLGGQLQSLAREIAGPDKEWESGAANYLDKVNSHLLWLGDKIRNAKYNEAIINHCKGKKVLEIGCGTGILSMMAARAGASHVYSCDISPQLVALSKQMVAANGFEDKITVLLRDASKVTLEDTDGPVDVVIHELMGSNLFNEAIQKVIGGALEAVGTADTVLIPDYGLAKVQLAFSTRKDSSLLEVDGFKYDALVNNIKPVLVNAFSSFDDVQWLSESDTLYRLNYKTPPKCELDLIPKPIEILVTKAGKLTALWFWWDVSLDESKGVVLSSEPTNGLYVGDDGCISWAQTAQPLYPHEQLEVSPGDVIVLTPKLKENGLHCVYVLSKKSK